MPALRSASTIRARRAPPHDRKPARHADPQGPAVAGARRQRRRLRARGADEHVLRPARARARGLAVHPLRAEGGQRLAVRFPARVRTAVVPRRAEGQRHRREDRARGAVGRQRRRVRAPGADRRRDRADQDPGHRQEDRRAHGRRAARPRGRPGRRGWGDPRRPHRDRSAVGGDRRAAAAGLQAGRGPEDGQGRGQRRRPGRNHHPKTLQSALR